MGLSYNSQAIQSPWKQSLFPSQTLLLSFKSACVGKMGSLKCIRLDLPDCHQWSEDLCLQSILQSVFCKEWATSSFCKYENHVPSMSSSLAGLLLATHWHCPSQESQSPSVGSPVLSCNRPPASSTKGLNVHLWGRWINLGKPPEAFFCEQVKYTWFLYLCRVTWNGKPPSPFAVLPVLTFSLHWFSSDTLSPQRHTGRQKPIRDLGINRHVSSCLKSCFLTQSTGTEKSSSPRNICKRGVWSDWISFGGGGALLQ